MTSSFPARPLQWNSSASASVYLTLDSDMAVGLSGEFGRESRASPAEHRARLLLLLAMDDAPEPSQERGDRQREERRRLLSAEMLVALPTLVISLALAYFSFVQADASRKMQRTETWPYVSYGTDNSSPDVKDEISLSLANDGVGPARLEEVELLYDNKPMRDPLELVTTCCAAEAKAVARNLTYTTDRVDGVLRPG